MARPYFRRVKRPVTWTDEITRAAHVRYMAGESSTALAAERGASDRGLIYAFHRLGLEVKQWGKQPKRKQKAFVVVPERGGRHECIYSGGVCLGCSLPREVA